MSESISVNVKEIEMHMWAVVKWGGSVGTMLSHGVGHLIGVGYVVVMSPSSYIFLMTIVHGRYSSFEI